MNRATHATQLYNKEIHPAVPPFSRAMEFREIPVSKAAYTAFLSRRASRNSRKSLKMIQSMTAVEFITLGTCRFNFSLSEPQKGGGVCAPCSVCPHGRGDRMWWSRSGGFEVSNGLSVAEYVWYGRCGGVTPMDTELSCGH